MSHVVNYDNFSFSKHLIFFSPKFLTALSPLCLVFYILLTNPRQNFNQISKSLPTTLRCIKYSINSTLGKKSLPGLLMHLGSTAVMLGFPTGTARDFHCLLHARSTISCITCSFHSSFPPSFQWTTSSSCFLRNCMSEKIIILLSHLIKSWLNIKF